MNFDTFSNNLFTKFWQYFWSKFFRNLNFNIWHFLNSQLKVLKKLTHHKYSCLRALSICTKYTYNFLIIKGRFEQIINNFVPKSNRYLFSYCHKHIT